MIQHQQSGCKSCSVAQSVFLSFKFSFQQTHAVRQTLFEEETEQNHRETRLKHVTHFCQCVFNAAASRLRNFTSAAFFLLFSRAELGLVTRPTNTRAHTERQPQREIDIRVFGPSSSLLVVVVFLLFVSTVSKFRSTGRLVVPCSVFFPFLFLLAAKKNKEGAGGIRTQQISNCCFFMPCRVHVN